MARGRRILLSTEAPLLSVADLTSAYGRIEALHGLSLHVGAREMEVVVSVEFFGDRRQKRET